MPPETRQGGLADQTLAVLLLHGPSRTMEVGKRCLGSFRGENRSVTAAADGVRRVRPAVQHAARHT